MAEDEQEQKEEEQRLVMQQAAARERAREEEHHRRREEEREAQQAAAQNLAEQQETDEEEDDDEEETTEKQKTSLEEQLQTRNQATRDDLEERVRGVRRNPSNMNNLYDAQNNFEAQTTQDLYNALEETRTYIAQQGGVTDKQYEALNMFEEEINRRTGYAQERPVNAVEEIKNLGRLRLGDDYIN